MVFKPRFFKIEPGDTVTFVLTDKGHNVETYTGLIPEGATEFKSKANEEYQAKFDVPGAYVIKCTPHASMGMVALIQVGEMPANVEANKTTKVPNPMRNRLDADVAQVTQ